MVKQREQQQVLQQMHRRREAGHGEGRRVALEAEALGRREGGEEEEEEEVVHSRKRGKAVDRRSANRREDRLGTQLLPRIQGKTRGWHLIRQKPKICRIWPQERRIRPQERRIRPQKRRIRPQERQTLHFDK